MSDPKPLSPSRRAIEKLKPVVGVLFLCAILVPYLCMHRLEHGTYFTPQILRLFPVSFGVCALLSVGLFFRFRREEAARSALGILLTLGAVLAAPDARARVDDSFFSEFNGFEIDRGRTWFDAMRASSEGLAFPAAVGAFVGLCTPLTPLVGAAVGATLVGTVSAAAGVALSLEAQRAEYDRNKSEPGFDSH